MTIKLAEAFMKAVERIDPEQINRRFPGPELKEEYDTANRGLKAVLNEIDANDSIKPTTLSKIEDCEAKFQALCDKLHPKTEMRGRSELNKIYGWVDAGYVERTIFLSGMAEGKNLNQPYKTQIKLLPCNACLFRYRQVYNVWEAVSRTKGVNISSEIIDKLERMKESYLYQMDKFAEFAYSDRRNHPMSSYFMVLTRLLLAQHSRENGEEKSYQDLKKQADEYAIDIPVPGSGMHYMHRQYHLMNYKEFASFRRLSRDNPEIAMLLERNAKIAAGLDEADLEYPANYYNIMPYVVVGSRVSLVGLTVALGAALSMNFDTIQNLLTDIWTHAVSWLPGINESEATLVAFHGGGPAATLSSFMHGGGPAA